MCIRWDEFKAVSGGCGYEREWGLLLRLVIGRKLNVHIAILALVRCSVGKIAATAISLRSGGCGEGHDWGLNGRVHNGRIIQTANSCFAVVCPAVEGKLSFGGLGGNKMTTKC